MSSNSIFLPPGLGTSLHLRLCREMQINPGEEDEMQEVILKGATRFLVTLITLPLFSTIGIIYNLLNATGKAGLGIIGFHYKRDIFEYNSEKCAKEVREHLGFATIDFGSRVLSKYIAICHAIAPDKRIDLQEKIEDWVISWASEKPKVENPNNRKCVIITLNE